MKVLITGCKGYIATELYKILRSKYDVIVISREDFDLTNTSSVNSFFEESNVHYDVVIHTASQGGNRLQKDTWDVFFNNIKMFENLYKNKKYFNKLISFGSGAEIYNQTSPYGASKNIINQIIQDTPNFYNLRIFAVFNQNELNTRFIKANILHYINGEDLIIHKNIKMDFFYMEDLMSLVQHFIENENISKTIDCCYEQKLSLLNIANIIKNLNPQISSNIKFCSFKLEKDYIGDYNPIPGLDYVGLEEGINKTYQKLKDVTF